MLPKLRQIEDEEPELNIVWDEQLQEIRSGSWERYRLKFCKAL